MTSIREGRFCVLIFVLLIASSVPFLRGVLLTQEQSRLFQKRSQNELSVIRQSNDIRHTNDLATINKLKSLTLDQVQWPNVDIKSVLTTLETESRKIDPSHVGFRFRLQLPSNLQHPDVLDRPIDRNVCVVFRKKTNFFDLLYILSEQTNLSFTVQKNTVTFMQWKPDAFIALDLNS